MLSVKDPVETLELTLDAAKAPTELADRLRAFPTASSAGASESGPPRRGGGEPPRCLRAPAGLAGPSVRALRDGHRFLRDRP